MFSHGAFTVLTLLGVGLAFPNLHHITDLDPKQRLSLDIRNDPDGDSTDLSYVKSWAALGDSYAAGIGSGKPLGDIFHQDDGAWSCSRWDQSYPYLMHQSEDFSGKDFKFLACSGWTSSKIKDEQVPKLDDKSQQIITLSSGGNDVYLSDLLDHCVYQLTPGATVMDLCKAQMDKTSQTIDNELFGWLDDLYTALKAKLTDDGKIYVTGYARFWNPRTSQCDDVSWKFWRPPPLIDQFLSTVKLTKANRLRMNELAMRVNDKIREVIRKNHADKIVFVDIDPYVTLLKGRFCESDVVEPDVDRERLLFYNVGTVDIPNSPDDPWSRPELKRSPVEMPKESFEGQIAERFEHVLRDHPDWQMSSGLGKASVKVAYNSTNDRPKIANIQDTVSSILPDTFKRIFHPRPFLHGLMAQLVIWNINNERAILFGYGRSPQRAGSLPPNGASCKPRSDHGRPRDLVCKESEWRAPVKTTADGSTSVESAIQQFCKNRHGLTAEKGSKTEHIYDRWDISGWGVTKRQSLWLRASSGPFSQCSRGTLDEKDCIAVLSGGLSSCARDSDYTAGYRAQGENCMEYAVELSASVHEGNPPWAEHVKKFPPPETLMADMFVASGKHQVDCYEARGGQWNWKDADAAIEQYCNNDLKNGGNSKKFSVQKGSLTISASVDFKEAGGSPYKDKDWCR
ncbi:hypothetical protein NX059_004629 [Plenodomus lindquistii]|nr:hypothetical protein NX059_004629 [Plenodomus lindquistii]